MVGVKVVLQFLCLTQLLKIVNILINVNDEFKTDKKAKKQAIKWAKIYGQMPKFLKKKC